MSILDRVKTDLYRYNPTWHKDMSVSSLATWMCSWLDSTEIYCLYIESHLERKAPFSFEDMAYAIKLNQASYVALEPEDVRRMALDSCFKELLAAAVEDRKAFRKKQREGARMLADALKSLLPRYPYNKLGG